MITLKSRAAHVDIFDATEERIGFVQRSGGHPQAKFVFAPSNLLVTLTEAELLAVWDLVRHLNAGIDVPDGDWVGNPIANALSTRP